MAIETFRFQSQLHNSGSRIYFIEIMLKLRWFSVNRIFWSRYMHSSIPEIKMCVYFFNWSNGLWRHDLECVQSKASEIYSETCAKPNVFVVVFSSFCWFLFATLNISHLIWPELKFTRMQQSNKLNIVFVFILSFHFILSLLCKIPYES